MTLPIEARQFLAALFPDDVLAGEHAAGVAPHAVNLRGLVHGGPPEDARSLFLPDMAAMEGAAGLLARWNDDADDGRRSVYVAPGVRRGKDGTKAGVAEITALWADLDAKMILGTNGTAPTATQRQEGKARGRAILGNRLPAALQPSLLVDSGGGLQAWWLLKEPAPVGDPDAGDDRYAVDTLEGYLKGLARHLGADPTVAQLAALMRLPGFVNRKYADAPMAHLLRFEPDQRYNLGDFAEYFLDSATAPASTRHGPQDHAPLGRLAPAVEGCDFLRWARDHQAEVSEPLWWAMLSNLVRLEGGREAAHAFSRDHPRYTARETDAKLDHVAAASGPITCAKIQALGFTGCPPAGHDVKAPAALAWRPTRDRNLSGRGPLAIDGRAAIIVRASDVKPETLSWLWPGRLAVGALTNVVGLPDQGKSLIHTDLAARVSTGSPMPPAPQKPGALPPHRVLILTQEDSPATTVIPRLVKAGANLERIDLLQMVRDTDGHVSIITLGNDLDVLEAVLTSGTYGLLIVDGIAGYLGADAKTHNDADVRRVLMPFAALLDRMKVAGLSVMHPPKAVTNLAYFAGGSVAFSAIPRVTLGVAVDPDDDGPTPRRFLGKLKGNLYGRVPTLAYQIKAESDAGVPWIEWALAAVAVDLATVFDPPREAPEERGPRRACEEWLRAFLADGPRHSIDVEKAAQAAGHKARTLRRARERVTDSVKAGTDRWDWILRSKDAR